MQYDNQETDFVPLAAAQPLNPFAFGGGSTLLDFSSNVSKTASSSSAGSGTPVSPARPETRRPRGRPPRKALFRKVPASQNTVLTEPSSREELVEAFPHLFERRLRVLVPSVLVEESNVSEMAAREDTEESCA